MTLIKGEEYPNSLLAVSLIVHQDLCRQEHGTGTDFWFRLAGYAALGTGDNVATGPGEEKASAWRAKGTMGSGNNVRYLSWLDFVFIVSSSDFH